MTRRSAFALRDLLVSMIVLLCLAALTLPALSQVRMDSSRQACIGNYRFIAQVSGSYSNDYAGYMWALSWKRGMANRVDPWSFGYFATDTEAQAGQAVTILRRLAHLNSTGAPLPASWSPQLLYSHAVLFDYVNVSIPASFLVCPEDWIRQRYLDGDYRLMPQSSGDNSSTNWRIPYSSSYTAGTYQWGPSRQTMVPKPGGGTTPTPMWYPNPSDVSTWTSTGDLSAPDAFGPRQESAVRFPSNKVFMSDDYARHNGKPRYYAYQTAGQDLLFYDGSVRFLRPDSTNPGWNPSTAGNRGNMKSRFSFTKRPDFWGVLDNNATQANFTAGWYRLTRGGLYGWDVPRLSSMVGKLPNASTVENEVDTSAATGAW